MVFIVGGERKILMKYLMHKHVCRYFQTHFQFELGDCVYYPTGTVKTGMPQHSKDQNCSSHEVANQMTVRYFEKKVFIFCVER